jgi:hypothetical protein
MADKVHEEEKQRTIILPSNKDLRQARKPLAGLLVLAVLCGLSFYGGTRYQQHHSARPSSQKIARSNNQTLGPGGGRGFGQNGGPTFRRGNLGSVTAVNSSSIIIKLQSGTSNTYSIGDDTIILNGRQTAAVSDIKIGDVVAVSTSQSDNNHAIRIMINPSFGGQPTSADGQAPDSGNIVSE